MSGGMRQGEQAKCPHCGVPLTGMNSNPDDCLQKPSEPASSEEVRKLDPDEAFSEWYEYAKRQESRNGWSRQKLAARAFAAGRKFLSSALRAERERVGPPCTTCGKPTTPTFTCNPCVERIAAEVLTEIEAEGLVTERDKKVAERVLEEVRTAYMGTSDCSPKFLEYLNKLLAQKGTST